ncbi:hypothetical protein PG997_007036 [Apiospora hydei]|uniref:Uncharacterized protein n=1 Tax=Apiospora hydei TaxID=1337664 RepID=A0ABR1WQF0_9PEZI
MSLSTTCRLFWTDAHAHVVSATNETAVCDGSYTQCLLTPRCGNGQQLRVTCDSRTHFPHQQPTTTMVVVVGSGCCRHTATTPSTFASATAADRRWWCRQVSLAAARTRATATTRTRWRWIPGSPLRVGVPVRR